MPRADPERGRRLHTAEDKRDAAGSSCRSGGNWVSSFCKSGRRASLWPAVSGAHRALQVQINDQVGTGALFYAEVLLSPRAAFAILLVRASLPLDSLCSANTPTHELGVPPAAALPILTGHTVPLETLTTRKHEPQSHAAEPGSTGGCLHLPSGQRPLLLSLPVPNLAWGSGTRRPKQPVRKRKYSGPEAVI